MKERQHDLSSRGELRADGASSSTVEESSEARGLSQTTRDPARKKRNAGQAPKSRCLPDRQAGASGRGGESSSLTESPNGTKANGKRNGSDKSERESAASDDATGTTLAGDAASSAAACAGRDAYAEVAAPRSRSSAARGKESGIVDDRRPRASDDSAAEQLPETNVKKETQPKKEYPPGIDEPLASDAPGFVDEMHARVNLYEIGKEFLHTSDLKLKQRTWEYLLEMKYGRGAPATTEEMPRVDVELPRPQQ